VPVSVSSTTRFPGALLVPLRWAFVFVAVLLYLVVVPIVEFATEIVDLVRRTFARLL
jgi:hypothetical protein